MHRGRRVLLFLLTPGPIYSSPVSAAGWTVPDQDIGEICTAHGTARSRPALAIYPRDFNVSPPVQVSGVRAYAGFRIWPNMSTVYPAFGNGQLVALSTVGKD